MGVVMVTWHIPAQHPANISLTTVSLPLKTERLSFKKKKKEEMILEDNIDKSLSFYGAYPSLLSWWRKKSLAASFMAFSGVTRVRFTAAPETEKYIYYKLISTYKRKTKLFSLAHVYVPALHQILQ